MEHVLLLSFSFHTRSHGEVGTQSFRCMQGLVMPPRVAPTQVVVIPIPATSLTDEQRQELKTKTHEIVAGLKAQGLRVHTDDRDNYRPGWKYNHWELKVSVLPVCPQRDLANQALLYAVI